MNGGFGRVIYFVSKFLFVCVCNQLVHCLFGLGWEFSFRNVKFLSPISSREYIILLFTFSYSGEYVYLPKKIITKNCIRWASNYHLENLSMSGTYSYAT